MAMILSNAARLRPEIRLAQAVSRFEACLSGDEKAAFGDSRAQAIKSCPTTSDVMRFTAQIDRRMSGNASRCLGPRFTNFVSSVQQFAALGDVIVGGSQNIVACGVWSVVRMAILVRRNLFFHIAVRQCYQNTEICWLTSTRQWSTSHRTLRKCLTSS